MSDEYLAEAAKVDPGHFALIYDRYVRLIYQYCRRRLWDIEAAEDATSTVFMKALAGIATFSRLVGQGSLRSWPCATCRRAVIQQCRSTTGI